MDLSHSFLVNPESLIVGIIASLIANWLIKSSCWLRKLNIPASDVMGMYVGLMIIVCPFLLLLCIHLMM